jgi:hypothetical protein
MIPKPACSMLPNDIKYNTDVAGNKMVRLAQNTCPLFRLTGRRAGDVQIVEPGSAVELRVDCLDEPWLRRQDAVGNDFQDDNTGDRLLRLYKARC